MKAPAMPLLWLLLLLLPLPAVDPRISLGSVLSIMPQDKKP